MAVQCVSESCPKRVTLSLRTNAEDEEVYCNDHALAKPMVSASLTIHLQQLLHRYTGPELPYAPEYYEDGDRKVDDPAIVTLLVRCPSRCRMRQAQWLGYAQDIGEIHDRSVRE